MYRYMPAYAYIHMHTWSHTHVNTHRHTHIQSWMHKLILGKLHKHQTPHIITNIRYSQTSDATQITNILFTNAATNIRTWYITNNYN